MEELERLLRPPVRMVVHILWVLDFDFGRGAKYRMNASTGRLPATSAATLKLGIRMHACMLHALILHIAWNGDCPTPSTCSKVHTTSYQRRYTPTHRKIDPFGRTGLETETNTQRRLAPRATFSVSFLTLTLGKARALALSASPFSYVRRVKKWDWDGSEWHC